MEMSPARLEMAASFERDTLPVMKSRPSQLEIAERAYAKAQAAFADNPTDENSRTERRAWSLVRTERAHEQKRGKPVRPPDSD
jgi:hypothetical protein